MIKKIKEIYSITLFEDNQKFNYLQYPEFDSENSLKEFKYMINNKVVSSQKIIIYEDGSEYLLPISEQIIVLDGQTSFLVIFDKEPSKFSTEKTFPWFFERPNNAAIYHSDGTLLHQLIMPEEGFWKGNKEGWYINRTYYADFPNLKGWGVMITNDHHWPDLCFCLYDGTPNLIWTGYSQDRR
ncbi:hypothetical protein [Acinetobacter sp. ANC 5414]|uniref:hypothetical protein n=1 Tax=Acinetobacter sp. ANC 5414 TaxID=2731251 RepID=UPI00148F5988|nr:hypothetical protein [Acinetobacter sp. ANC 5414]NNH01814.1 hypothetical protein [Acinetobacter sp. ANC 5414]